MGKDKWFRIINDEMDDIPARVEKMKSKYWQKSIIFIVLIVSGAASMGVARGSGRAAIGCFLAVTGITGIMALATMCHSQLCLYRTVMEIRKQEDKKDKSEQKDAPDKK